MVAVSRRWDRVEACRFSVSYRGVNFSSIFLFPVVQSAIVYLFFFGSISMEHQGKGGDVRLSRAKIAIKRLGWVALVGLLPFLLTCTSGTPSTVYVLSPEGSQALHSWLEEILKQTKDAGCHVTEFAVSEGTARAQVHCRDDVVFTVSAIHRTAQSNDGIRLGESALLVEPRNAPSESFLAVVAHNPPPDCWTKIQPRLSHTPKGEDSGKPMSSLILAGLALALLVVASLAVAAFFLVRTAWKRLGNKPKDHALASTATALGLDGIHKGSGETTTLTKEHRLFDSKALRAFAWHCVHPKVLLAVVLFYLGLYVWAWLDWPSFSLFFDKETLSEHISHFLLAFALLAWSFCFRCPRKGLLLTWFMTLVLLLEEINYGQVYGDFTTPAWVNGVNGVAQGELNFHNVWFFSVGIYALLAWVVLGAPLHHALKTWRTKGVMTDDATPEAVPLWVGMTIVFAFMLDRLLVLCLTALLGTPTEPWVQEGTDLLIAVLLWSLPCRRAVHLNPKEHR